MMTFEELRDRCQTLTGSKDPDAGDTLAGATLKLYHEYALGKHALEAAEGEIADLKAELASVQAANAALKRNVEHYRYCMSRVKSGVALGETLDGLHPLPGGKAEATTGAIDMFQGVLFGGKPIGDAEPRPRANVPVPKGQPDNPVREPNQCPVPTEEMRQRIEVAARAFNLDANEAAAVAHTRAAQGLDAGAYGPPLPQTGYAAAAAGKKTERVPNAADGGAGNKE